MNKETEQSLKVIERKIKKQEAVVEVKRQKYTMVAQDYTNAENELKSLKKIRDREVEKQRMQRLQNVCSKNNIDISVVTEMIENGKMNILLETVKEAEKQKSREESSHREEDI